MKPSISKICSKSITTLGQLIKAGRIERSMKQADLAERLNISRYTIIAIEKGDPKVAIGIFFEAAHIVGIPLLAPETDKINQLNNISAHLITLLPKRAPKKTEIDDDF